jgi:hypothetical protein
MLKTNLSNWSNLDQTFEDCSVDFSEELSGVGLGFRDDDEPVVVQNVTLEVLRGAGLHRAVLLLLTARFRTLKKPKQRNQIDIHSIRASSRKEAEAPHITRMPLANKREIRYCPKWPMLSLDSNLNAKYLLLRFKPIKLL